ncbi:unnamed protein product [Phytomonas sp. EM1]|nr:unnamed protein product [Phytomonas sp. EM1]|eukprot:CCW65366.1 unnamed protein product [Phytomonas sp. isolate EM1]
MSDKIDDAVCYSAGSAYLSGLPVVVAGYQMPCHGIFSKIEYMEAAIKNAELQPEDVIVVMESGTFFTGVDINPLLDRFIAQSAATPEELDALAVRQGRAMAPLLLNAEAESSKATILEHLGGCKPVYEDAYEKVRKYAVAHPEHKLALPFDVSRCRYLDSGVVVARVWAYKDFSKLANNYVYTQILESTVKRGWLTDQSIYIAFYLDLITWEVERDVFSMPMDGQKVARSSYGMRAGLLGLDYTNAPLVIGIETYLTRSELHDEQWAKYLPLDGSKHPHSRSITRLRTMTRFVHSLYKRAYAAHGQGIYARRAVPRWIGGKRASKTTHITFTPPLLTLKQTSIDTSSNKGRTYPAIFHSGGLEKAQRRESETKTAVISTQWFLPMVYDPKAKRQAWKYLASAPLFLSTHSSIIRDSYYAKCGFPFEGMIKKLKGP